MLKKLFNFITKCSFFALCLVAVASCGTTDEPGDKPNNPNINYTIELGKHEADIIINTSESLAFDFLPDYPDDMSVTWTSSNPAVASVSSSGYVTGLSYGQTTITATMNQGGATDTCVVTVCDPVDYVSNLKLSLNSTTKKAFVTTRQHVDGDTTHFYIDSSYGYAPGAETGVLKARYLGIDTPESTGQIEEWGKKASNFTKNIVTNAYKILIESDSSQWDIDSTGARCLVWVWYQMQEGDDWRNLNIELLQEGLALAKNTGGTKYGEIGVKAIAQAKALKKYIYGKEKDPDFYYGAYQPVTIKELRTHLDQYKNTKVSFDCTVGKIYGQTVYVEDYDEDDKINYGMQVYLGFNASSKILEMTYPNYRIKVAGSLQYYEAGQTYQVSDVHFDLYSHGPDIPDSFHLLADADHNDKKAKFQEYTIPEIEDNVTLSITEFVVDPQTGDDYIEVTHDKDFTVGALSCCSTAEFKNLTVTRTYTTATGDSKGAISLTCKDSNDNMFVVRTEVLKDASGNLVTADQFESKVINAKGIIDYYNGSYQLRVLNVNDITIVS